jgi:hypothetical protein
VLYEQGALALPSRTAPSRLPKSKTDTLLQRALPLARWTDLIGVLDSTQPVGSNLLQSPSAKIYSSTLLPTTGALYVGFRDHKSLLQPPVEKDQGAFAGMRVPVPLTMHMLL